MQLILSGNGVINYVVSCSVAKLLICRNVDVVMVTVMVMVMVTVIETDMGTHIIQQAT